jgi:dephospho-CoA kinase
MLRVALTGGIATGKSHVLARLHERGIPTIDADRLARAAVAPGTEGWAAIYARFGEEYFAADRTLDRRKMGELVFRDADSRRALEGIVHPAVYAGVRSWFEEVAAAGTHPGFAVADIPLLYETGREGQFDRVIATVCSPETQVQRIVLRDRISPDEARRRLDAQLPAADKGTRADYVIRTDGTFADTDAQIDATCRALAGDAL